MNFGLIGCGAIGVLRAQAISQAGEHKLVAVSDLDQQRAQALAGNFNAVASPDWRSLIDRGEIDAVVVSTPPDSHAEICMAALRAGKHVLCEKPLTRTLQEAKDIVAESKIANRILCTGFNYRFYPSFVMAKHLLEEGRIGELDHIRSYTGYTAHDHHQAWLHDYAVMGGGTLRDNGIHLIDLTLYFLGGADTFTGLASGNVWGFPGCEDNGFLLMRNPEGKIATLQSSWTEWAGFRFGIEIYGERGIIRATCFPMLTEVIWRETPQGKIQKRSERFWSTFIMEHWKSYRWVVVQSFIHETEAFARAVRGEASDIATGADGLLALEAAQAAENHLSS